MQKREMSRWLKIYAVFSTFAVLIVFAAFLFLLHHAGYDTKILVRLGIQQPVKETNWAVVGWNNAFEKLDYDADIVFFGDSIIRGSDFRVYFPEAKIVNSGYPGDSLKGMPDRIPGIVAVSPEKVFIMGGINGLKDSNIEQSIDWYETLLDEMETALPEAELYVQSVIPVSVEKEASVCHNVTIQQFNQQLSVIAQQRGHTFIDLYSLYEKDGKMDPDLTKDGIHLLPEAYALWAAEIQKYICE